MKEKELVCSWEIAILITTEWLHSITMSRTEKTISMCPSAFVCTPFPHLFPFSLQVSETLNIFEPNYNYYQVNTLEDNGYQLHISLYNKGVCGHRKNKIFLWFCRRIIWQFQIICYSLIGAIGVTPYTNILLYARV